MKNCPLCNSTEIEKISDREFTCKNCAFGTNGKAVKIENYYEYITKAVALAKLFWPHLEGKELTDKVMFHLHRVEKHPTRPDGYCEYCEKVIA